jgi:salicylate hydroxylase/6-hydroxynicotinate 3-monooxygenase
MTRTNVRIAVIGAGMGGLTAAAALRRFGFEVDVYEQAERFLRIGAGIQVASNPMKVLRSFGLEDKLRAKAFQPQTKRSRDYDTGTVRAFFDTSQVAARYGAPHMVMHRGDLHAALASLLPDDVVHRGRKLVSVAQDLDGVTLRFASGPEVRADAVIAADGTHSTVRSILFGDEAPTFAGRVAYRATFPAALAPDVDLGDGTTKWWGPDRHIVMYYITAARDEVYFTTSVPTDTPDLESWSLKADLGELRAAFRSFHPDVRRLLDACPEANKWPIYDREPLGSWGVGRVYLLGDAAHPMTPYMAQGAAVAIEDAAVLARCLQGVESGGLPRALECYEATRRPRASKIQTLSHQNARDWMRADADAPAAAPAKKAEPGWVFGYDAWSAPLAKPDLALQV